MQIRDKRKIKREFEGTRCVSGEIIVEEISSFQVEGQRGLEVLPEPLAVHRQADAYLASEEPCETETYQNEVCLVEYF